MGETLAGSKLVIERKKERKKIRERKRLAIEQISEKKTKQKN